MQCGHLCLRDWGVCLYVCLERLGCACVYRKTRVRVWREREVCTYVFMFVEIRGGCGGRQASVCVLREGRRLWRERDVHVEG